VVEIRTDDSEDGKIRGVKSALNSPFPHETSIKNTTSLYYVTIKSNTLN
jgi:hypothetical protein